MKLIDILENKSLSSAKNFEIEFLNLLNDIKDNKTITHHNAQLLKMWHKLIELSNSSVIIDLVLKPSSKNCMYGRSSEPKSDINVMFDNQKVFHLSIKKSKANYLISVGSNTEFKLIVDASMVLMKHYYPQKFANLSDEITQKMDVVGNKIGSYVRIKYGNRLKSSVINRHFSDSKIKKFEQSLYNNPNGDRIISEIHRLKNEIIQIISDEDKRDVVGYEVEKFQDEMRKTLTEIFLQSPEFAKCFMWELASGVIKFNGINLIDKHQQLIGAYADTILYPNKIWDISNIECDFISESVHNFKSEFVRLQNVPRGSLLVFPKFIKEKETLIAKEIADAIRVIEISFKLSANVNEDLLSEDLLSKIRELLSNIKHKIRNIMSNNDIIDVDEIIETFL